MSKAERNLRPLGLKNTYPRLKILELFERHPEAHLSADDVYRLLLADGVEVGVATVYRVLTQFEQAGVLARHHFDGTKAVYELAEREHHDHLVCLDCGHIEEFQDAEIEARQRAIAANLGFALQEHALYLFGRCQRPDCPHRNASRRSASA